MTNLTLVKSDRSEKTKEREVQKKSIPDGERLLYSLKDDPRFNILTYWKEKGKELQEIARRESILINNSRNLSEGKKRLYDKALVAFQIFADAEDIKAESEEMRTIAYDLLLYYIDKFYPGVNIELGDDNKVIFMTESQDQSDRSLYLLRHLVRSWIDLTSYQIVIAYDMLLDIYLDD